MSDTLFRPVKTVDYHEHGRTHVYDVTVDATPYVADLDGGDADAQDIINAETAFHGAMHGLEHQAEGAFIGAYQDRVRADGVPGIETRQGSLTAGYLGDDDAPGYDVQVRFPDPVEAIGTETAATMVTDVLNGLEVDAQFTAAPEDGVIYAVLAE